MPATKSGEHGGGGRTLQRQQRPILLRLDRDAGEDAVAQTGEVGRLARGVDDEKEPVSQARRHQIVDDAARFVEQERIAQPHRGETLDVAGGQRLQRRDGCGAREPDLAHMRDIEEAGLGAGMLMFGDNPRRVVDRHLVAGETHHAGAQPLVKRMERGPLQRQFGVQGHPRTSDRAGRSGARSCPLCRGP